MFRFRSHVIHGTPSGPRNAAIRSAVVDDVTTFGGGILLVAAGLVAALFASKLSERISVPAAAPFLLVAAVASDIFPRLSLSNETVIRVATVALIVILFDGGLSIGWRRFRELTAHYSLGMTEQLLRAAVDAGQLADQPLRPLAHVLIGALDEGAMVIADADDEERARREVREVLLRLLDGLLVDPG